MSPNRGHGGQRPVDTLSGGVVVAVTLGHCPTHHGADSLPDAAGGLLACSPYRREQREHVGPRYAVSGQPPQLGHGVAFERSQPICGALLIPPARTVHLVARAGSLAEGWRFGVGIQRLCGEPGRYLHLQASEASIGPPAAEAESRVSHAGISRTRNAGPAPSRPRPVQSRVWKFTGAKLGALLSLADPDREGSAIERPRRRWLRQRGQRTEIVRAARRRPAGKALAAADEADRAVDEALRNLDHVRVAAGSDVDRDLLVSNLQGYGPRSRGRARVRRAWRRRGRRGRTRSWPRPVSCRQGPRRVPAIGGQTPLREKLIVPLRRGRLLHSRDVP